jgi:cobalt-zinc-cadmium efflux system membrane fusion protein
MSKKDAFFLAVILFLAGGWGYSHYTRSQAPPPPAAHGSAAITGGPICPEHKIPEAKCGFCNEELTKTLGFCKGHGVPEVFCYQCDPDLIPGFKAAGDWCKAHARPESQCAICKGDGRHEDEGDHDGHGHGDEGDHDGHGHEEGDGHGHGDEAPGDQGAAPLPPRDLEIQRAAVELNGPRHRLPPAPGCTTHDLRVRFRTPEVEAQVGLGLLPLGRGPMAETVVANATLSFDQNHHAHLTPRAVGIVREVLVDVGDRVEAGDVLATVDSQELGTAKAALLQAQAGVDLWQKNRDREKDLRLQGIASERKLLEAETRLTEARIERTGAEQRLRNLGLSEEDVARVARKRDTSSLLPVVAPFAGEVVSRHAVVGEVVDTGHALVELTDPSRLWAMVDLYEEDLLQVEKGQRVLFDFDGLPGRVFTGPIHWISRTLDSKTRTLRARVVLENPDGLLRAEMFGRARVELSRQDALRVPKEAVQWDGTCNTVFVRQEAGVYEPRRVWLGLEDGAAYEVRAGLEAGEVVVTTGSFLLKTEVMKGSIGAGCCEVDGPRS